jgi:hypothetical protein
MVNKKIRAIALYVLVAGVLLAGCSDQQAPLDDLFPPHVGDYLRIDGPNRDTARGLDQATYQGPDGSVLLRVKFVGKDQVQRALDSLPLSATNVGFDPALGQRKGQFFTYDNQFHASWGNGDWVFIISAPTESARVAFLAGYGF